MGSTWTPSSAYIKKKLIPARNLVLFSCGNTSVLQVDYFVHHNMTALMAFFLKKPIVCNDLTFARSTIVDNRSFEGAGTSHQDVSINTNRYASRLISTLSWFGRHKHSIQRKRTVILQVPGYFFLEYVPKI